MAARLANDRAASRDPTTWGVGENVVQLDIAGSQDVEINFDPHRRGKIVHARRSSAFDLVSMTAEQEWAARRYWRDWCHRAGVMTEDPRQLDIVVDHSPGLAPGQFITQRMIDAGRMLDAAHAEVGRADANLLRGLVEPLVMHGQVHVWRVVVERLTGEKERHAQAAAVRRAVENLRLAYEALDEGKRASREEQRSAEASPARPSANQA